MVQATPSGRCLADALRHPCVCRVSVAFSLATTTASRRVQSAAPAPRASKSRLLTLSSDVAPVALRPRAFLAASTSKPTPAPASAACFPSSTALGGPRQFRWLRSPSRCRQRHARPSRARKKSRGSMFRDGCLVLAPAHRANTHLRAYVRDHKHSLLQRSIQVTSNTMERFPCTGGKSATPFPAAPNPSTHAARLARKLCCGPSLHGGGVSFCPEMLTILVQSREKLSSGPTAERSSGRPTAAREKSGPQIPRTRSCLRASQQDGLQQVGHNVQDRNSGSTRVVRRSSLVLTDACAKAASGSPPSISYVGQPKSNKDRRVKNHEGEEVDSRLEFGIHCLR